MYPPTHTVVDTYYSYCPLLFTRLSVFEVGILTRRPGVSQRDPSWRYHIDRLQGGFPRLPLHTYYAGAEILSYLWDMSTPRRFSHCLVVRMARYVYCNKWSIAIAPVP